MLLFELGQVVCSSRGVPLQARASSVSHPVIGFAASEFRVSVPTAAPSALFRLPISFLYFSLITAGSGWAANPALFEDRGPQTVSETNFGSLRPPVDKEVGRYL